MLKDRMVKQESTGTFDIRKNYEFVQCLNLGGKHWIIVSTVECLPAVIRVYSLHHQLPLSVKMIADLVQAEKKHQTHEHSMSKGWKWLWFVAATALCHEEDPVHFEYEQSLMWCHLPKAFKTKTLLPFHSKTILKRRENPAICQQQISTCRSSDNGPQMAQCSQLVSH